MNTKPLRACLLAAALSAPLVAYAQEPAADGVPQAQFVSDPTITTAVKVRLADYHVGSLPQLRVDADRDGIVWLSGTTLTQEAADRAVEIARNADGVVEVRSTIVVVRRAK